MQSALWLIDNMFFFFFNDTATTEIYTLSLHDALPICWSATSCPPATSPLVTRWKILTTRSSGTRPRAPSRPRAGRARSEEHTSELQSRLHLVCRLLLEKKKTNNRPPVPVLLS